MNLTEEEELLMEIMAEAGRIEEEYINENDKTIKK